MGRDSRKVVYNTAVQIGARVVTSLLGILTLGSITRFLNIDLFGQLSSAIIFLGLVSTFSDAGLGIATVRELSLSDRTPEAILGTTLVLRMLVACFFVAIGLASALVIFRGHQHAATRHAILYLSVTLLLATLQSSVSAGLMVALRHDLIVIGDIAGRAVTLAVVIITIRREYGFSAILLAYLLGAVVNCSFDIFFGLRRHRPSLSIDPAVWFRMLKIALPLGASGILTTVYFRADGFILSLLRSSAEVGRYGVAYRVVEFALAFPAFFAAASFPVMVAAGNDMERVTALGQRTFEIMGMLAAPVALGTAIMSPELAVLVGGQSYRKAAAPMAVLMLGTYFGYFSTVFGNIVLATGEQRRFLRIFAWTLGVNVAINVFTIPKFGAIGAAWAVVVSEIVAVSLLYRSCHSIGVTVTGWTLQARFMVCALVMVVIVWWSKAIVRQLTDARFVVLSCSVLIGIFIYVGSGILTRTIRGEQFDSLRRRPSQPSNGR